MIQNINQIIRFMQLPVLMLVLHFAIQKKSFWKSHHHYFIWFIKALIFYFIMILFLKYFLKSKLLNQYFNYFFLPTDFVLLGLFLKGVIYKPKIGFSINILSYLFVIYGICNFIWIDYNLNEIGLFIQNVYLIILSLLALKNIYIIYEGKSLYENPDYWFVIGILLSYITFFFYLFAGIFNKELNVEKYRFVINTSADILNILYFFLFIKGIKLIEKPSN